MTAYLHTTDMKDEKQTTLEAKREQEKCKHADFFLSFSLLSLHNSRATYIKLMGLVIGQHVLCHPALTKQRKGPCVD